MRVMKNTILYSLFIVSSMDFSLHSQDIDTQDNDDLLMMIGDTDDNTQEEIYPLEDLTVSDSLSEAQLDELSDDSDFKTPMHNQMQPVIVEEELMPLDVVIDAADEDDDEDTHIKFLEDNDPIQALEIDMTEADDFEPEDCPISIITQDQLEELLSDSCDQAQQQSESCADDELVNGAVEMPTAIPADDKVLEPAVLQIDEEQTSATVLPTEEDDDIIPVPHELINSVKKANKEKKRLEKLERKEKANFFKKSKKQQKKNAK